MLFEYTKAERQEIQALEDAYAKLLEDAEAKADALRAEDPEPDPKRIAEIDAKIHELAALKPEAPVATDYETMTKYHESKAYKAWYAKVEPLTKEKERIVDEWYLAGSKEWYEARTAYFKLEEELAEARKQIRQKAEDRYFASLGSDLENIYRDACSQAVKIIEARYCYYLDSLTEEYYSFSAYDIRVQEDGSFLLDRDETLKTVNETVERHIAALKAEPMYLVRLADYINRTLDNSPYVTSEGILRGNAKRVEKKVAVRPSKHVTTLTKVNDLAFKSKLMRPLDAERDSFFDVSLNEDGNVIAHVAIDYAELVESGVFTQIPKLTGEDLDVHDAIITLWYFGNRTMTYDMIYRAMTGKMTGKICVSDEIYEQIDRALRKFGGRVTMQFHKADGKDRYDFEADEPIIFFRRCSLTVNGKRVERAIEVVYEPVFLRWGKANRNEIDTRDIKLLDVPKLNNGKESAAIRRILLNRIVKMRREFEVVKKGKAELPLNRRRIRYDYLYGELGLDDPDKDKRKLIKQKVDRILDYWTEKDLIAGYEHVRDSSRAFYAIDLSFLRR